MNPSGFSAALPVCFEKYRWREGVDGLVAMVLLAWLKTACRWALSPLRDSRVVVAGLGSI